MSVLGLLHLFYSIVVTQIYELDEKTCTVIVSSNINTSGSSGEGEMLWVRPSRNSKCHTATTTLYVKFRTNNTEIANRNL